MIVAYMPLAVCIVGGLLYAYMPSDKVQEMGRLLFAVGAFFVVVALAGRDWKVF